MTFIASYFKAQLQLGCPWWHIRDQLDVLSSAFRVQITAFLKEPDAAVPNKRWISIDFAGEKNHEFRCIEYTPLSSIADFNLGKIYTMNEICASVIGEKMSFSEGLQHIKLYSISGCVWPDGFIGGFACCLFFNGFLFRRREFVIMMIVGHTGYILELSIRFARHFNSILSGCM